MKNKPLLIGIGLAAVALGLTIVKRRRVMRAERWNKELAFSIPRTALVTGASSGIGEAYARRLASLGYDVILVARREERLKSLAADLQQRFGIHTEVLAADLSTPQGIEWVEKRISELDKIDFLVNNAGFAVFGNFAEIPIEEQMGLINCQTIASVRFCRAVLPGMIARKRGAIVNVSSIGAFTPKPKDVTYCASKAYLNVFSEALQMELAETHIRVQVLCPGFTITEFHDHPQYAAYQLKKNIPRWLWMTSEAVVAESLKRLAEGGVVCIPGFKNRLIVGAARSGLTGYY
ncbi:MAG: SDR family oxidoreductase [Anaerolineales bacterium]|nr:SDR family oxidoreductase [Anaerolineales bacterium]